MKLASTTQDQAKTHSKVHFRSTSPLRGGSSQRTNRNLPKRSVYGEVDISIRVGIRGSVGMLISVNKRWGQFEDREQQVIASAKKNR